MELCIKVCIIDLDIILCVYNVYCYNINHYIYVTSTIKVLLIIFNTLGFQICTVNILLIQIISSYKLALFVYI